MTTLFHLFEHLSTLIVLLLIVLFAMAVVKLRQYRMSEAKREQIARQIRQSRVDWHPDADGSRRDRHV